MAEGFYNDVCKEIAALGFRFWKPAKGSHEKWRNEKTGTVLLVPRHLRSRHTANGILKDAGATKRF
uniref:type II toxin-antitoxin system HicA family toxin n=1 Tax=Aquibium sp. A9E412 TaxID=2976767 RepID=UPI00339D567B